jgi:D-3-phosphoglycerate dehydrogenase
MKKVLLADKLPEECTAVLQKADFEVENRPGLSEDELREAVEGVSGIICRSGAKITEAVLEEADFLEAICRAGVGVDNIDVEAASRRGVVVMNTPGANTISTAEHTFALLLALARNVGPAYLAMREGRWEKRKFLGAQLSGTTLGVIGLGRIGQEVARRALAFDMTVVAYDPFVSSDAAEKIGVHLLDSLEDLLKRSDYVTLHVPENAETKRLIGREQIVLMKDGARLINCARGAVVDQEAIAEAVDSGKLAGAAFDVYTEEPPADYSFARHDAVLATPHLGASTEAAQLAVAMAAAEQLIEALSRRHYRNAVNVAAVPPDEMKVILPFCQLATQLGRLVAQLSCGRPKAIEVACRGSVAQETVEPIVNHGAMGVMQSSLGSGVNIVSAPHLARDRGIHITSSSTVGGEAGFTDLVLVTLETDEGAWEVGGTVFGRSHPRIVRIEGFFLELAPEGHIMLVFGEDVPGLIGRVGMALGEAGVNIARMGFGRRTSGGKALLALNLDTSCDAPTVSAIAALEHVERVVGVEL